jgi:phosphoglycolate phosphatase
MEQCRKGVSAVTLADIVRKAGALLLDFDGPVCSVFAGMPAFVVANQLKEVISDGGRVHLPGPVARSRDPFDVLRYAVALGEEEGRRVEAAFAAHEVEAISSAVPTDESHALMWEWHSSGRPIGIVSNNSNSAVEVYLNLYGLRALVDIVAARSAANIALLKPNPYLIQRAASVLGVAPSDCVFVGDSHTDVEAAREAGVPFIGYINKPEKKASLAASDAVVEDVAELCVATR